MLKQPSRYYYADILEDIIKEFDGVEISYDMAGVSYSGKELVEHLRNGDEVGYKFCNEMENVMKNFFMKFKK